MNQSLSNNQWQAYQSQVGSYQGQAYQNQLSPYQGLGQLANYQAAAQRALNSRVYRFLDLNEVPDPFFGVPKKRKCICLDF